MDDLLSALRAVAEPSRLRIVLALSQAELSVSELCQILGQSQPRVSRHLKILAEAEVLVRHSQGTQAYYRVATSTLGGDLVAAVTPLVDAHEFQIRRDAERVAAVRSDRAEKAAAYFESIAADWESIRAAHVSDDEVETAMVHALRDATVGDLIDIGTGTGRVLELFAASMRSGLGVDLSTQMLNLARSRLDEVGVSAARVRQANCYDLPLDAGSFDTAVLHHLLHFLDDPAAAVREAARTLRPGGRLLIVDFAPHDLHELAADFAHRRLGFAYDEVREFCTDAGLVDVETTTLAAPTDGERQLDVCLWIASQHPNAPSTTRIDDHRKGLAS